MGVWDYDEIQKKLDSTNDSSKEDIDVDLDALEDDKVSETETEEGEETEEVAEKETEEKVAKETPSESGLTAEQQASVKEQMIKIVGPDTILKVKGIERKASDLNPAEVVTFLQKGMNADRLFQEHATSKRELDQQRQAVEQGAAALQEYLREHQTQGRPGVSTGGPITSLPDYLRPSADDTPEINQWKLSQVQMLDEVNAMKQYIVGNAQREVDQKKVNEILALRDTYPMASMDEVLAVKSARPNIDSEELVRASHNYYSGADFMKKSMASNPTFKREYDAEVIKNYLAKKSGAPKIPGKKGRGSSVEKVSFGAERKNFKRTFEDADSLSREYLTEVEKIDREG